jgi:hypothetical protein
MVSGNTSISSDPSNPDAPMIIIFLICTLPNFPIKFHYVYYQSNAFSKTPFNLMSKIK